MIYEPRAPAPPLGHAIEVMFFLDGYQPDHRRERIVPNGQMTLVIELDGRERHVFDNDTGDVRATFRGAWLSGLHANYFTIGDTAPGNRLMAAQIAPGMSMTLTGRSASDFADRVVPAVEVFGDGITALRDRLAADAEPSQRLDELESWLTARMDESLAPPAPIATALSRLRRDTSVPLTELSEQAGISHRHFVAQFRRFVGTTPKVLQRIWRFYAVFERIQGQAEVNWAELAAELGFSDQAHFIREFRAFSGFRPKRFHDAGHDRPNFFPDDD
ncbi:MAG: AraC family transcriptional regulator [bacterium]|nr:AraC family transcriptional regulator [bacterium]